MNPRVTVHLLRLPNESRRTARRVLHELLAAWLGRPIADVSIRRDGNGKPHLIGGALEVSQACRGPWCAVAFSPDCPVGIDVEVIDPRPGLEAVVAEFFPREAALEFAAAPVSARPSVFFRWWTRLEAAVKACGRGLDEGLSCLGCVQFESFFGASGLVLSVATRSLSAPAITWPLDSRADVPVIDEFIAPDFVSHGPPPGIAPDRE